MWETWVQLEIPRRRERLPTSIFLPRESPRTEEPGGLLSMGSRGVGHNWATKHILGLGLSSQIKQDKFIQTSPWVSICFFKVTFNSFVQTFFTNNNCVFLWFVSQLGWLALFGEHRWGISDNLECDMMGSRLTKGCSRSFGVKTPLSKYRCRESLWQNSTSIYDKNSPESRHRRIIPQHN